jgi:hypothetical protein
MADVDAVCRTIDDVAAETRRIRLELDRLVKAEKESRKAELVRAGADAVRAHYAEINATLGEHAFSVPPSITADIGACIKGLKTLSSMRDKIDAAVASAKIDASQRAERVRACIAVLAEFAEHAPLFADRVLLCATKAPDDLRNLAAIRIEENRQREAQRERIRAQHAEQERIRAEEAARLELDNRIAREYDEEMSQQLAASGRDIKLASIVAEEIVAAKAEAAANHSVTIPVVVSRSACIRLGEINAALSPISITGEGLAQLGFHQVAVDKNAKLYDAADFPRICEALVAVLRRASMARAA